MFHYSGLPSLVLVRRLGAVLLVTICSFAGAEAPGEDGAYVPYSDIERGTKGVAPVALRIENGAGGPVACTASLAHWYSASLGDMAPSEAIDVALWHNPNTGEINLLNELEDRMPVEAIWCSRDGSETRTRVDLVFTQGVTPPTLTYVCVDRRDGRLSCTNTKR